MTNTTHFVIPLAHDHSERENMELRLMLRSLQENYLGNFKVTLIADKKPYWLKYVNFIQKDRITGSVAYENFYDTLSKLEYIARETDLEEFIYIYDDVILSKKITGCFFDECYYMEELPVKNKWTKTIQNSLQLVPGHNYETHMPVRFNRIKLKLMFENYPYSYSDAPYAPISLYFNTYSKGIPITERQLSYKKNDESIWINYVKFDSVESLYDKFRPSKFEN